MESLTVSLKKLTNEVSKLKRKSREASFSNKFFKKIFKRNTNQPTKSTNISNVELNFEDVGMDTYCTFHSKAHSENTLSQWIQNMMTKFLE